MAVLGVSKKLHSTAGGDTSFREEKGLEEKFKGVTKFIQYCQRRHKFERRNRLRGEV